jgi:lia operon protein LiaG
MIKNMKTIWKVIILAITAGLILAILGFILGASRSLYLDRAGVHIYGNGSIHIIEHDLTSFKNIDIDAGFTDVEFVSSDTYGIEIKSDNARWDRLLENDTLTISLVRNSRVQIMNFNFLPIVRNYVKIFIPNDSVLGTITVKTSSGDVNLRDIRAESIDINSTTGNIRLYGISSNYLQTSSTSGNIIGSVLQANSFIHNTRTGDGRLQVMNVERFSAESTSGDLTITGSDLVMASITARTGNIIGNDILLLNANVQTTSGDIRLNGEFLGEMEIQARTGDVRVSTSGERNDYSYTLSSRTGTIRLDGERFSNEITSRPTQERHIAITTTSGDINLSFTG